MSVVLEVCSGGSLDRCGGSIYIYIGEVGDDGGLVLGWSSHDCSRISPHKALPWVRLMYRFSLSPPTQFTCLVKECVGFHHAWCISTSIPSTPTICLAIRDATEGRGKGEERQRETSLSQLCLSWCRGEIQAYCESDIKSIM